MAAKQTPINATKATAPQFTILKKRRVGRAVSQRRRYHTLVSIWLRKLGSVAWAGAIRNQSRDGSLDLACAACIQHHKVYAENICRRLHLCCFGLGKTRIGPVDKEGDRPFCRLELMQQFEALCGRCSLLLGYAREVASAAAGGEDEQGRGFFKYHKPSSYFGQYGDERVTEVGRYLDAVLEAVLRNAAD
jgi:hypothetical protein